MSGQAEFLASIKDTISKAAPRHKLQHPYPYNDMWVYPPNPTMRSNIIVRHHHRRPVSVWLPDLVKKVYGGLVDKKTKQPLFRAEALEAVKRLRVHIVEDCCNDAPNQALYLEAGKDSETRCTIYRCVRGTNDLEGYHLHMRLLVAWCLSPRLAHLLLLEHNYRWNLRQSINNRGLSEAVGEFYDQPMLEAIQRMTSKLYGNAKYSDWLPTSAYADTGERCGFVRSIFASNGGGGGIAPVEEILGGEYNCGLEPPQGRGDPASRVNGVGCLPCEDAGSASTARASFQSS
ncbi:unnamed protein product [Pylaiella littoralis]